MPLKNTPQPFDHETVAHAPKDFFFQSVKRANLTQIPEFDFKVSSTFTIQHTVGASTQIM